MKRLLSILISLFFVLSSTTALACSDKNEGNKSHDGNNNKTYLNELRDQLKKDHNDQKKRSDLIKKIVEYKKKTGDGSFNVFINGEDILEDGKSVIKYNNILIPKYAVTKSLRAELKYDSRTHTVTITKDKTTIIINLEKKTIFVNNKEIKPNVLTQSKKNGTLVLFKFIAETLGRNAEVDEGTGSVIIEDENIALNKTASADSKETANPANKGNDGSLTTRWCAADGSFNHWWKVDLGNNYNVNGLGVTWEIKDKLYKYKVETSVDNVKWALIVDKTNNSDKQQTQAISISPSIARYIRVTVTGFESGCWASFFEFKVSGTLADNKIINDNITGAVNNQFNYVGSWDYGYQKDAYLDDNHWSKTTGSYYEVKFYGTQIKLYGAKASSHGKATVTIDNIVESSVDFYAADRADNTLIYTSPIFEKGQHTLKVKVTGTKNSNSTDYYITADKVEIIG